MIECIRLGTGYAGVPVSRQVDLTVRRGEILSLIGPNGCGKTTLLRTMAGLLPPQAGSVQAECRDLARLSERELARLRAYLPQLRETPDITVGALVAHGRFPYLGFSRSRWTAPRRSRRCPSGGTKSCGSCPAASASGCIWP